MGANQSFETDFADVTGAERKEDGRQIGERKYRHYADGGQGQQKRRKAKPAAPHRPNVAAVTHNAVSLTWLPPRHTLHAIIAYTVEIRKPRQAKHSWATLTKNCQGTHYDARHLDSDTEYVFRVRAENIFGTGKPSAPSSTVTTKIFEMSSDLNCYISPTTASPISPFIGRGFPKSISYEGGLLLDASDSVFDASGDAGMVKSPSLPVGGLNSSNVPVHQNQYGTFKRRHSFNVQLNGRVSTILNHSDRFYSSSSLNSSTSTIVVSSNSVNNNNNNNDTDSIKTRSGTILRNNIHRTSLQPTARKTTIPILFPGTGSNSLNRLRESRASLKSISSSDVIGNHSTLPRHRGSLNRNIKSREFRNSLGSTASDSNTNTTSSTSSSTSKEDNNNKTGQGSRLSLQSVLSDVTMSNQSQSSDDLSSRPLSFLSELGENSELGSFLNGGSIGTDSTKIFNGGHFHFDNDKIDTVKSDDYENCLNDDEDDIIYKLKRDLKNIEITEEKLKFHDLKERLKSEISEETSSFNNNLCPKDYYQTLDNPWERDTQSVNGVSENIMAAPFSDDIKIALNAKHNSNDVTSNMYRSINQSWVDSSHRDNFRTLRSVLQSNHIIVKQSRSMPEVVGVVLGEGGETRTLTRGKLTTIEDEDEEEEAVRVTTL